jgi:methyl-accepting chemotaxis protein/methyl-accepting chemotaxis protein-1 (serine sensor receptor)
MQFQFTIGKKLAIGVTAFVACLAVLSVTSLRVISTLGDSLNDAVNINGKKLDLLGGTREAFEDLKSVSLSAQIAYAIAHLEHGSPAAAQGNCTACHSPEPAADTLREVEASGATVRKLSGELRPLVSSVEERKAVDTLERGALQWVDNSKEYLGLASSGQFDAAHAVLRDKMFPIIDETDKAAKLLAVTQRAALAASDREARKEISSGHIALFIVIGLNLLVAAAVLWLVFTITSALRQTAVEIGDGASEIASAASEVSSSSQSLAQGSSEQAASLQETSASSGEINAMARKNTGSLGSVSSLVTESQQHVGQAQEALSEMVTSMNEINASSGKISKIIQVIDEIALQTNILALNAAVEAARAGEAGLGFAVVANEVRNLAQRSAQSAKDTAGLIEESIAKSKDGRAKLELVAAAVGAITDSSTKVKSLVDKVAVGSREQAHGSEQVAKAIAQMEKVTQTTAASAEESAAAAESLSAQSATLQDIVERLTAMVGSGNNKVGPAVPRA